MQSSWGFLLYLMGRLFGLLLFAVAFILICRCCALLCSSFQVQRQQPAQDLVVAQVVGPAVGRADRRVELAVRLGEPIEMIDISLPGHTIFVS
jgi:hypothetical protein